MRAIQRRQSIRVLSLATFIALLGVLAPTSSLSTHERAHLLRGASAERWGSHSHHLDIEALFGKVRGVAFIDSGAGMRVYIPQFGDVPIAIDLGDVGQIISFSAELPF